MFGERHLIKIFDSINCIPTQKGLNKNYANMNISGS
jgi:hypothetical protein